jgi:hypothetical protein
MGSECRVDLRRENTPLPLDLDVGGQLNPNATRAGLKFSAGFGKDWTARATFNR